MERQLPKNIKGLLMLAATVRSKPNTEQWNSFPKRHRALIFSLIASYEGTALLKVSSSFSFSKVKHIN
jgi:hypothetical protein